MEVIQCRRCREERPALAAPPFRGPRGERIQKQICAECWGDWLKHQTLLINHYGLDPRDQDARAFLYDQIDIVLLGDGEAAQVDTS
jgi:Fe-S cluster biosynthesis and repair protein YggX